MFCQENKNSNVDNFFPELDKNLKSFVDYEQFLDNSLAYEVT